jgi:polyisoprenyl-phosphate glycosyltransferase
MMIREEAPNVCYSIVVPAYNESESLPTLIADLVWLMDELDGTCEVLIVDDGSSDNTYEIVRSAQETDHRFRAIRLSRNFGHQTALTAGLTRARGSAMVTMDADRQHPVETVLEMARHWRNGYDIAYGVMIARPSESAFKKATSNGFYKLINRMSNTPMPANAGDFRLLDRQVVDAFLRMPEHNRYIRGMISWLGFEQVGVPYTCERRHGGRSTYTVRRMIKFAVDALLSFSTWALRAGLVVGFIISGLSVLFGLTTIVMRLFSQTVPGWATIVVVVCFLGGAQLTLMGLMGEYVGRIYDEVKRRPLYVTQNGTMTERAEQRVPRPPPFNTGCVTSVV